jgi:hypothetical protein
MISKKYWKIECYKHMSVLYQSKVNVNHITEKKLIEFIKILISKYALSDDEVLETYMHVPFKPNVNYIKITRTNSGLNEPLRIMIAAQSADISVNAWLVEESY